MFDSYSVANKALVAFWREFRFEPSWCPCSPGLLEIDIFFVFINQLHKLFSGSPHWWEIVQRVLGCSLPSLSDTGWSAQIKAVRPVAKHLPRVIQALDTVITSGKFTSEAKAEAQGLKSYFQSFNAVLLLTFWVKVLQCIEDRNLTSQSSTISPDMQAVNIKELEGEIACMRASWDSFLTEAETQKEEAFLWWVRKIRVCHVAMDSLIS